MRHESPAEPVLRVAFPVEKWSVHQNTATFPTDAYGTIEFQGGPHPTKAQVTSIGFWFNYSAKCVTDFGHAVDENLRFS